MLKELVKYPFHVAIHPFKGFWEVKYEGKGRLNIALIILLSMAIVNTLRRQFGGFIVNTANPNELNSLNELIFIILPFFLFCISNWAITTLMDGEGKFKEIIIVTAYALLPLVLVYLINIPISNFITIEEAPIYYLVESAAILWAIALLFIGIMTVHQYTVGKTVGTFIVTLIVIGIILFLGLLFFSLIQQMISFGETIYKEIIYRL